MHYLFQTNLIPLLVTSRTKVQPARVEGELDAQPRKGVGGPAHVHIVIWSIARRLFGFHLFAVFEESR